MNRSSNGGSAGGAPTNPKPERAIVMAHFDMLPPAARAAVREAALDWDTIAIVRAMRNGMQPSALASYIAAFEAKHLARPE